MNKMLIKKEAVYYTVSFISDAESIGATCFL